jgi:hypothetical protein
MLLCEVRRNNTCAAYSLTKSKVQEHAWKAEGYSYRQEIQPLFM